MSSPQHEQAVTALAVLITAWQHGTTASPARIRLTRFPSRPQASNYDHAATTRAIIIPRTREPRHDTSPRPATGDGRSGR
ncbi:MAG TPA: hypothetical protein VMA72_08865 [Streptosporangiaceae bacterium]|nr:hypothetical protein [Streptosporangiaceae bacterium]